MSAPAYRLVSRPRARRALAVLPRTLDYARRSVDAVAAAPVLRRRAAAVRTVDEAIDFANGFSFRTVTIETLQNRDEIGPLLQLLEAERPRTVVEIGTFQGGTFFLFSRVAAPDALLLSIDLHHGEFGGGYSAARAVLYRAFARERQRVELVRADSHDPATLARARRILGGRPVDFLFVDGDHSYDGVRRDFELYSPLVRPGGLVAFHDIQPDENPRVGVAELWRELEPRYEAWTLVSEGSSKGIGVLRMPAEPPSPT